MPTAAVRAIAVVSETGAATGARRVWTATAGPSARAAAGAGAAGFGLLRSAEQRRRPLQVVVERDHDVHGHDDGEPAESCVHGRGEDRDLGEEADDAWREAYQAEQEEAHREGGERAGGVQASVVGETVVRLRAGDKGGHGEGAEVHDGVHEGVRDGGADLFVAGVGGGGDRHKEVAGLGDGRPGEQAYGAAGAGGGLAQGRDVTDGHGEGGDDGKGRSPDVGVRRERDHGDEDQPGEADGFADDRQVGGDRQRGADVGVGDPEVEGCGCRFEGEADESEGDARLGEGGELVGDVVEAGGELREVEGAGRRVHEADAEEHHSGRDDGGEEELEGSLGGAPVVALDADEGEGGQRGDFEGDDKGGEVAGGGQECGACRGGQEQEPEFAAWGVCGCRRRRAAR